MNDFIRNLRKTQTDAESLLWHHLRDRRFLGIKFRRQQKIGKYIVDFVCFEKKLVVELDGSQHFDQHAYDTQRTKTLEMDGFRVVRLWNNDVLVNTESVLEHLRMIAEYPSPPPSPTRGEGELRNAVLTPSPLVGDECMDARGRATQGAVAEGRGEGIIAAQPPTLLVRHLGLRDYSETWRAMQQFTAQRDNTTPDEIWLLEHPPVFTQGLNGRREHLLAPGDIPLAQTDRGGQVTYHGPGQLVAYVLFDLQRRGWGVRQLVEALELAVIDLLRDYGITATARRDAPGVYVDGAKIAALGLRVKRGRSYHGLSLNVAMDLEPFSRINPCGYAGLPVTQLAALGIRNNLAEVADDLLRHLSAQLGYNVGHTP